MKNWFSHALPETREAAPDDRAIDPEWVREWVDGLPVANVGESTEKLYRQIHHINRLRIPVKDHYTILESLGEPLEEQLPLLERHYCGMPFPPTDYAVRVNQLSTHLQGEMVVGYRQVLQGAVRGSWFERHAASRRMAQCAHRIYHYMDGILFNCQIGYRAVPVGLWSFAHGLYQLGQMRHKLTKHVDNHYKESRVDTWESAYLQFLLLSLIPAHALRRVERRSVIAAMGLWTERVSLVSPPNGVMQEGFYLQHPSDSGPFYVDSAAVSLGGKESQLLNLDTHGLCDYLRERLAATASGEAVLFDDGIRLDYAVAEKLADLWSKPRTRSVEREPGHDEYELAIGISSLHHLPHTLTESWNGDLLMSLGVEGVLAEGENYSGFEFDVDMIKKAWVDNGSDQRYGHSIKAMVVDWSDCGCRLSLPTEGVKQVVEGELVALRREHREGWRIGTVQWLRTLQEGELQLGIQLHARDGFPVQIRIRRAYGTSEAIDGLIAIGEGRGQQLYLPYLPGLKQKELMLIYQGMGLQLRLTNRLLETTAALGYSFEFVNEPG